MSQLPNPSQPSIGSTKLVIIALVLAVVAVVANSLYIRNIRNQVAQDSFEAYVLTRSVLPGDRLRTNDVRSITLPKSFQTSLTELGAMDKTGLDIRMNSTDQPIRRSASAGEILRYIHFEIPEGKDIDTKIPVGKRLVSLPVNSRTLPGALREGMFVDIEAPFQTGGALPQVMPVMENVKIIAIGSRSVYDDNDATRSRAVGSYYSITIEVDPADATRLSMVQRLAAGDFEIQVRNPGDTKLVKITNPRSAVNQEVLDLVEKKMASPPAPKR
jgi:Flp pilus assembly protein CpaB